MQRVRNYTVLRLQHRGCLGFLRLHQEDRVGVRPSSFLRGGLGLLAGLGGALLGIFGASLVVRRFGLGRLLLLISATKVGKPRRLLKAEILEEAWADGSRRLLGSNKIALGCRHKRLARRGGENGKKGNNSSGMHDQFRAEDGEDTISKVLDLLSLEGATSTRLKRKILQEAGRAAESRFKCRDDV